MRCKANADIAVVSANDQQEQFQRQNMPIVRDLHGIGAVVSQHHRVGWKRPSAKAWRKRAE